jgi:catechol 2,3-dioxygenase-like lactoylglutathione lyase family enzyme
MKNVLSHVDLRVRNRALAIAFYDAILGALGFAKSRGEQEWITYSSSPEGEEPESNMWFGFTVDPAMTPGPTRVAFAAGACEDVDRVTTVAREVGAANIEGPDYAYGPEYYAVFFDDPDGNKLEVCCYGAAARAAS